jgi:hypothetical protein
MSLIPIRERLANSRHPLGAESRFIYDISQDYSVSWPHLQAGIYQGRGKSYGLFSPETGFRRNSDQ